MINAVSQNQPSFKGVVLKKVPNDMPLSKLADIIESCSPNMKLKGANKRGNQQNVLNIWPTKEGTFLWGQNKAAEEVVFNNLSANKTVSDLGMEVHKIDDWA